MPDEMETPPDPKLRTFVRDVCAALKETSPEDVEDFLFRQFTFVQGDCMEFSAQIAEQWIRFVDAKRKLGQMSDPEYKINAAAAILIGRKIRENKPKLPEGPLAANEDAPHPGLGLK